MAYNKINFLKIKLAALKSADSMITLSMDEEGNVVLHMVDTGIPQHVVPHLKIGMDKEHAAVVVNMKDAQGDTCDTKYYLDRETKNIVVESTYPATGKNCITTMSKSLVDADHLLCRVTKVNAADQSGSYFTAIFVRTK